MSSDRADHGHRTDLLPGSFSDDSDASPGAIARAVPELPDGTEIAGRYRIIRRLGKGGMGAVYLAHDALLDRPIALKVPHAARAEAPDVLRRFQREARAAAQLHHPGICPIHDVGQHEGLHYLTMAYIEGQTLSAAQAGRPLQPRAAVEIVRTLALALQYAHERGVIHRDLKPGNIMVAADGRLFIMDFGLAKRLSTEDTLRTPDGAVMGTPQYMPPEQIQGRVAETGPTWDIYSLGVILYQLLAARLPFQDRALWGLNLGGEPTPLTTYLPQIDPELESICLKTLAYKPGERHASMAALAAALGEWLRTAAPPEAQSAPPGLASGTGARDETILSPQAPALLPGAAQAPPEPGAGPSSANLRLRGPDHFSPWTHGPWISADSDAPQGVPPCASSVAPGNEPPGPGRLSEPRARGISWLPERPGRAAWRHPGVPTGLCLALIAGIAAWLGGASAWSLRSARRAASSSPDVLSPGGWLETADPARPVIRIAPEAGEGSSGLAIPLVGLEGGELIIPNVSGARGAPVRRSTLPPFAIARRLTTRREFARVLGRPEPESARADEPVTDVSWTEAVQYCRALEARLGEHGVRVRLPAEREWIYVATGGSGEFREDRPEPLGVQGLFGEIAEWLNDPWMDRVLIQEEGFSSLYRVIRQGGRRKSDRTDGHGDRLGFRVVVEMAQGPPAPSDR